MSIRENLKVVHEKIAIAADKCGKNANDISLIAVTKTLPADIVNEAIRCGVQHIGENRIQEARSKLPQLMPGATHHMIGHLQRNKVKYAVKLFDMIQSVDNITLAEDINTRCANMNKQMPILIEVNTSGEPSKIGCPPKEAITLLQAIDRLPSLSVKGFMTIAIYNAAAEKVRDCFKCLKGIYDEAQSLVLENADIGSLSMGMSSDFEMAIEEGATMVRIGSAIFGRRQY